jgi:hypothetical protein
MPPGKNIDHVFTNLDFFFTSCLAHAPPPISFIEILNSQFTSKLLRDEVQAFFLYVKELGAPRIV